MDNKYKFKFEKGSLGEILEEALKKRRRLSKVEKENITILARFSFEYSGNNKIEAIKTVRAAFSCGLREAKDFVEAGEVNTVEVRLSPEKFGLFTANIQINSNGMYIKAIRIENKPNKPWEFI